MRSLKVRDAVASDSQFEGQHKTLTQIKILYVEDYDLVLSTVKQLLELEGWSVQICRDGAAALKRLESREPYDLVVLDSEMLGICGLELLKLARSMTHRRRTPVLMFTATDCEREAAAAGANAFLKKPSGIRELIPTIENLLGGQELSYPLSDQQYSQNGS